MKKPSKKLRAKLQAYYRLTKPGIIYGNLLATIGAFLFGADGSFSPTVFLGLIIGTSFVIACGCVINNYLDQSIDQHMKRTKKRALVTGEISGTSALVFARLIGGTGLALLYATTNQTATVLGLVGLLTYAGIYTFAKPRTALATLIGTVPGALPPVAGYVAATGVIDTNAWILFVIMVSWQMVHFYAISLYRIKEYRAAKIPVMPVKYGVTVTKIQMLIFVVLFAVSVVLLGTLGTAGTIFLIFMALISLWWLYIVFRGYNQKPVDAWARRVFGTSLVVLLGFNFLLAINPWVF